MKRITKNINEFELLLKSCEIKFEFKIGGKKCKLILDIENNVDMRDVSVFLSKHANMAEM